MISLANFLTIADSLAQQARVLNDAFSTGAIAGGEPISGTGLGQGPLNNIATVLAANDAAAAAALAGPFGFAPGAAAAIQAAYFQRLAALNAHVGGIGTFLAENNARVATQFRDLLWRVPPAQVFPAATDPVASFAVTGSGAGTFTHNAAIDATKYGPAAFQLVATDGIGGNAITATLTLTKLDGTSTTKQVVIAANSLNGATFPVDAGAIAYVDCSAISITGGTNADSFKVRSLLERAIAL